MIAWWEGLTDLQQLLVYIALPATVLILVLLILMTFGVGEVFDGDVNLDLDPGVDGFNDEPLTALSGLKVLSLRGALAFLSVGGWSSLILTDYLRPVFAILLGVVAGSIAAVLIAIAFKAIYKLERSGNLDYSNAVGKLGNVYIKIPRNKTGKGKVILTLQERYTEIDAITEDDQDLKSGTAVEVTGVENESTLIVKRK